MIPPKRLIPFSGPPHSKVLIVGEYPGADEEWKGHPFAGTAGGELNKMLNEVGLIKADCRLGYAIPYRPPRDRYDTWIADTKSKAATVQSPELVNGLWVSPEVREGLALLEAEIAECKPDIIVTLGKFALWALTGETSVDSWRGSFLEHSSGAIVMPTFAPMSVLRMWEWRTFMVRDLRRVFDFLENPEAYHYPAYNFQIRPSFSAAMGTLDMLLDKCAQGPTKLSCDIETIARHIACVGIAWTKIDAICIPLLDVTESYWSEEEEYHIVRKLREVLTHPNAQVIGQNFNYDNQHFAKHWGYLPRLTFDTMVAQHTLFPGLPKALDFLSSMYCHYHRYWKDELKDYHRMPQDVAQFWTYNCKDCVITFEVEEVLAPLIVSQGLSEPFAFQMTMLTHTLNTMLRGIRINIERRGEVAMELMSAIAQREEIIHTVAGFPLNVGSPKQMQEFFYKDLGIPPIIQRKTKRPTCDDEAMKKIAEKHRHLEPLTNLISEKRSLSVFLSTFCLMQLDSDLRMRCSYNICGTETYRLNSSENAFGNGGNLQNIPKGEE